MLKDLGCKGYRVGDLVKIIDNVHDEAMPKNRIGMIVEIVGKRDDQVLVMFGNFQTLKFHTISIAAIVSTMPRLKSLE